MKKIIFVFALIYTSSLLSQSKSKYYKDLEDNYSKGYEYKDYFELKGSVKEVLITVETSFYSKPDSVFHSFGSKEKLVFNESGYLLKKYYIKKDGLLFLKEENKYDASNNLIYKKEYAKEIVWEIDSLVWEVKNSSETGEILFYEEKFTYTDNNKLLTKHIKSSHQEDFFISKINEYNSYGLLKKQMNFNNHIDTWIYSTRMCEGNGSGRNDYIYLYEYDSLGNLINEKTYFDDSHYNDTIGAIKERSIDYSSLFKLSREEFYKYDSNKNLIYQKVITQKGYYYAELNVEERFFEYNNDNKLIKRVKQLQNGNTFGTWYMYEYEKEFLQRITKGYIETKHSTKRIAQITEYNKNGSRTTYDYNGSILSRIHKYNTYGDLVERESDGSITEYKYTYDKKENWIQKVIIKNNRIAEEINREIQYY